MLDYGVAGHFEERFWDIEGERAEARASRRTSNLDNSLVIAIEEF